MSKNKPLPKNEKERNQVIASFTRPHLRTSMNYEFQIDVIGYAEHPTGPDKTVPGMTMDLETLIKRSMNGLPVMGRVPQYSDDDSLPEFYKMSPIEIMEFRLELAESMERDRQKLHEASKVLADKQDAERKALDKEYEERKKFVTEQKLKETQNPGFEVAKP